MLVLIDFAIFVATLQASFIELDARVRPRTLDHVRYRLCRGQVLGKIESGDHVSVRDLH